MRRTRFIAALCGRILLIAAILLRPWGAESLPPSGIATPIEARDPLVDTGRGPGAASDEAGDRSAVLPPATTDPDNPTTGATSLTVRVVRRESGDPVPGFWVSLIPERAMSVSYGYDTLEAVTDERGEVLWEDIEWNRVAVFPAPALEWFDLEEGQHNERIHEVSSSFTIEGEVVDPRGLGVAGAEVWTFLGNFAYTGLGQAAASDAAGRFSLPILESDHVFVFARGKGMGPSRVALVTRPDDRPSVELRLAVGDGAGTILGEVVSPDGRPIVDAWVRVHHSTVFLPVQEDANMRMGRQEEHPVNPPQRTDAAGGFRLEGVAVGEASVMAIAKGRAGAVVKVDVLAGSTSRLRITLGMGARVLGTIRDTDGEPVPGVTMVARRHDFAMRSAITDPEGRYLLENVQPGQVMLEAMHPTRGRADRVAPLEDGEEFNWEPVFSGGRDLRGVVSDHAGVPVAGMRGYITGEDGEYRNFQTDAEGVFNIDHCKDQGYEVKVFLPEVSLRISIARGVRPGGEDLDLRLPEPPVADAYVTGRTVGPLGRPVSAVSIHGREEELEGYVSHDLDSPDGGFRLGPIIGGTWRFSFDATGYPVLEQTVAIPAGKVTDIGEIQLEAAVAVEILVRKPASVESGISGSLWGLGFDHSFVRIESGRAVLPPLRAGNYRLQIMGEDVPYEVREFELVPGREIRLQIDLQVGVPRSLQVVLPDGIESSALTFASFDASGRELASWRMSWYSRWGPSPLAFRPEATRLVVTCPDGRQAETDLRGETVRVDLR